jgi:hypothetical protein
MLAKSNFEENEVSLEIDLVKMFGEPVKDSAIRRAIAEEFISIINKRTKSGYGVSKSGSEVELTKYSPEYINSLEFKAFGKKADQVNMKLTGSMLASIDLIDDSSKALSIGIDNEEAPKAFNHLTGDTVKKRPFLGLTADDIEKVKSKYENKIVSKTSVADIFTGHNLARLFEIFSGDRPTKVKP